MLKKQPRANTENQRQKNGVCLPVRDAVKSADRDRQEGARAQRNHLGKALHADGETGHEAVPEGIQAGTREEAEDHLEDRRPDRLSLPRRAPAR